MVKVHTINRHDIYQDSWPDRIFHGFKASKASDRRFWTTWDLLQAPADFEDKKLFSFFVVTILGLSFVMAISLNRHVLFFLAPEVFLFLLLIFSLFVEEAKKRELIRAVPSTRLINNRPTPGVFHPLSMLIMVLLLHSNLSKSGGLKEPPKRQ